MTRDDTIHVRVNGEIKKQAEEVFSKLGISLSDAINMFLAQSAMNRGLPFRPEIPDSAPASVTVNSEEELMERLDEAHRDYEEGRYSEGRELIKRMRERYSVQLSNNTKI